MISAQWNGHDLVQPMPWIQRMAKRLSGVSCILVSTSSRQNGSMVGEVRTAFLGRLSVRESRDGQEVVHDRLGRKAVLLITYKLIITVVPI